MTQAEKNVLAEIVGLIQTLTVKVDALEGALIRRGVIRDSDRQTLAEEYLQAALNDLAAVRMSIASLPITGNAKG
jgi:hypothetical protein